MGGLQTTLDGSITQIGPEPEEQWKIGMLTSNSEEWTTEDYAYQILRLIKNGYQVRLFDGMNPEDSAEFQDLMVELLFDNFALDVLMFPITVPNLVHVAKDGKQTKTPEKGWIIMDEEAIAHRGMRKKDALLTKRFHIEFAE
jgi:hypothetical protein